MAKKTLQANRVVSTEPVRESPDSAISAPKSLRSCLYHTARILTWLILLLVLFRCAFLFNGLDLQIGITVLELPAVKLSEPDWKSRLSTVSQHVLGSGITILDSHSILKALKPNFSSEEFAFLEDEMGRLTFQSLFLAYSSDHNILLDSMKEYLTRKRFSSCKALAPLNKGSPQKRARCKCKRSPQNEEWKKQNLQYIEAFERDKRNGKFLLGEYVLYINGTFVAKSFDLRTIAPRIRGDSVFFRKVTESNETNLINSVSCSEHDQGNASIQSDNPPPSDPKEPILLSDAGPVPIRSIKLQNPSNQKKSSTRNFIVDTGATRTTVTKELAKELGLESTGSDAMRIADGTISLVPTYQLLLFFEGPAYPSLQCPANGNISPWN